MECCALLIVDDQGHKSYALEVLTSLGHTYEVAASLDCARAKLLIKSFAYTILSLVLPVKLGETARTQNGLNIIRESKAPVVVLADRTVELETVVSAMRAGAKDLFALPVADGDSLDMRILNVLKDPQKIAAEFGASRREIVIDESRIAVCGLNIWDGGTEDMAKALTMLSQRDGGHYVRRRCAEINDQLERDASNSIARPFKDFCDKASAQLGQIGIQCGRNDIIGNEGGYYLAENVEVRTISECDGAGGLPTRLSKICKALTARPLSKPEVMRITKASRTQIGRDISELERRGLVKRTGPARSRVYELKR